MSVERRSVLLQSNHNNRLYSILYSRYVPDVSDALFKVLLSVYERDGGAEPAPSASSSSLSSPNSKKRALSSEGLSSAWWPAKRSLMAKVHVQVIEEHCFMIRVFLNAHLSFRSFLVCTRTTNTITVPVCLRGSLVHVHTLDACGRTLQERAGRCVNGSSRLGGRSYMCCAGSGRTRPRRTRG